MRDNAARPLGALNFWFKWGLVPRLMLAVGIAIAVGGGVQTSLILAEGAEESSARLKRSLTDTLGFLAPLVADQALVGEYAVINQLLKNQVTKGEIDTIQWTDRDGKVLVAQDVAEAIQAPAWFVGLTGIVAAEESLEVTAGGVSYGSVKGKMTPVRAQNRLWEQFAKQLQIVGVTLFLMLQFIWLIFRGNLGTLRMLAEGANRFSQGDRAVRIAPEGAPEVRLAAEAFNNMANNTETLLASLQESETKNKLLATIVEQSSEAIWTEDMDGVVTSWNTGAVALFGYAPSEALGHQVSIGMATNAEKQSHLKRLLSGERFSYDTKAVTKAQAEIDIQVAVAPLVDDENRTLGRISVARDVTQRNRSEEELRLAREAAESANHAKSSFLARMSHEIRTPMNGVLGMTELLLETGLTSTQRKYAETVLLSGKGLLGVINDVLDFSKIEAGKLELEKVDMDVRTTVEDVVDLLAERAQTKGLEIACGIAPDLATRVRGDPLRLGQVLTNLAGNAIKFTRSGSVLINVTPVDETEQAVTLRFEVKDTGAGISDEAKARIFEEFSQADGSTTRVHGGTGLGLAISKQLVEMMDGSIHVESKIGAGSTFWFTSVFEKLPAAESKGPSAVVENILAGVRTLIVQGGAVSRGVLASQLRAWDMTAQLADSPEQAFDMLNKAAARRTPFDVAIVDLISPGMDSFRFSSLVKSDPAIAGIRLIVLAPVGRHSDMREAREMGIDACLVKPMRQSTLFDGLVSVMSDSFQPASVAQDGNLPVTAPMFPTQDLGNILLAEDNLVNQAVALGVIEILGYKVTVANNGREALELSASGKFDLVLMDCHMPEMDGFEATAMIRERERQSNSSRIPIIALTANAMTQDREACLNAGMDDHLAKPFTKAQLGDRLDRWLPRARSDLPPVTGKMKAVSPAPAEPFVERRVLTPLSEIPLSEQRGLLTRVITIYLKESPKLIEQLTQGAHIGDAREIARAVHSLKSSSANVGAMTFSNMCGEIESTVRRASADEASRLVEKVAREFERVQSALKERLRQLAV